MKRFAEHERKRKARKHDPTTSIWIVGHVLAEEALKQVCHAFDVGSIERPARGIIDAALPQAQKGRAVEIVYLALEAALFKLTPFLR